MRSTAIGRDLTPLSRVVIHSLFVIYSLCCIVPILVLISSSLSRESDILRYGYGLLPRHPTTIAYTMSLFDPLLIARGYIVTASITALGTAIGLWLTSTLGYVLAKRSFALRRGLSFYVLFTMLFNGGIVPVYILIAIWLGLKDKLFAMIVPGLVSAWYVLLMKSYFSQIPESISESAKMDGAGDVTIFVRLIAPISTPAFATVGLFLCLQYWNEWFNCLLYVDNEKLFTLQYILVRVIQSMEFLSRYLAQIMQTLPAGMTLGIPSLTARFALAVVATGPMLFVFLLFQKYFVKGLALGSIKG